MKLSYRKMMVSMFLGFVSLAATQSSFAMLGCDGGYGYGNHFMNGSFRFKRISNEDIRKAFSDVEQNMEDSEINSEDEEQLYGPIFNDYNLENFKNLLENKMFRKNGKSPLLGNLTNNYIILWANKDGNTTVELKTLLPSSVREWYDDDFKYKYPDYVDKIEHYRSRGYGEHIKYLDENMERASKSEYGKYCNCFYFTQKLTIYVYVRNKDKPLLKQEIEFPEADINGERKRKVKFTMNLKPEQIDRIEVVTFRPACRSDKEIANQTRYTHKVQKFDILRWEGDMPKTDNKLFNYVFSK